MVVRGEKLGGGPTDQSSSMLGIVSGFLFLESSRVHPTLLGQCKRLPHTETAHRKHTSGICGLAQEAYVSYVLSFSCMMYIDSSHHDSCGSQHVVNLYESCFK
jgi:hypothetical protein